MRFEFRHPVIASGIHAKSLQERIMVGMVSTSVDVHDLSSRDVVTAFEVESADPDDDIQIVQYNGLLYEEAGFDIADLLSGDTDFEGVHRGMIATKLPFRPLGDALVARIREIARAGAAGSIFPAPRSPRVADLQERYDDAIISYLSKAAPIPAAAHADEIEAWREVARRFVSNCILVDGRTYRRTGVPILCAGNAAILPASTNVFSRYMDAVLPSRFGGALPGKEFRSHLGIMLPAGEPKEARRIRRDMARRTEAEGPFLDSRRVLCHIDVPIPDLECLDLARFAKIHLFEARDSLRDYERHWGKDRLQRALSDPSSLPSRHQTAALVMKGALDAHEMRGEGIGCMEQALRALAPITFENRFSQIDGRAKQNRCRQLDVATKMAFERLDAMPIEVPVFATRVTFSPVSVPAEVIERKHAPHPTAR